MQILVHSVENYVYRYARANDIVQRRASKSPCWPKNLTTRTIFFHVTPFNALISPGAVFPDTSGGGPIMQMYEVKRPGPSYDRSETTPARSCGCSLYREPAGEGGRAVEHRALPPERETGCISDTRVPRLYTWHEQHTCLHSCVLS